MKTGKRNYPNAELVMHENEPKHWFDDAAMARGSDRAKKMFFQAGREQVAPYKDRWRLFTGGEVFPGVTALPRPGHTPGHTTFMISSGNEQLLIWGDTVHVPEVQTARPEVCMEFDSDTDAAAASRRKVFDMVATDRLRVTGMHLHFPGFAHLVRRGTGYQLIPDAWEQAL
jgi:glyoxylase-like metal-dependent hydrolase (beta-lactamase superfamily II)